MSQLLRLGGLFVLTLAFIVPTFGQDLKAVQDPKKKDDPEAKKGDDKKGDDKKGDDKKGKDDKEKEKVHWSTKLVGKITEIDANNMNDITIQVTTKVGEPNLDAQRQLIQHQQTLARQQVELAQSRNFQERAQRQNNVNQTLQAIANSQRDLVRYKDVTNNYKLRLVDNVKTRSYTVPLEYDDKGNVKKHTAKELAALRGDSGLPGYICDKDMLRRDQIVEVYLAVPKAGVNPKGLPDKGAKGLPKKKMDDDDLLTVPNRPEVVIVVIVNDAK